MTVTHSLSASVEISVKSDLKYETLTDEELLEHVRHCDMQAFDTIYYRYHKVLYTYALKLVRNEDDASDIVQEIFIKLWGYSDMMPKRLNLKSYLYSMVRNRVFNFMRDNRTRLVNNYKIAVQNDLAIENEVFEKNEERLLSRQLDNAIDTLPPQQRQVAKFRRMGLSNREIAKKMNLSLNTVNIHHRKSVNALKKKLTRTISLLIILWIW